MTDPLEKERMMSDPLADVRERLDLAETEFSRSEMLSMMADADALLAVVREMQKAGEGLAIAGTRKVFQKIAALPEHLVDPLEQERVMELSEQLRNIRAESFPNTIVGNTTMDIWIDKVEALEDGLSKAEIEREILIAQILWMKKNYELAGNYTKFRELLDVYERAGESDE